MRLSCTRQSPDSSLSQVSAIDTDVIQAPIQVEPSVLFPVRESAEPDRTAGRPVAVAQVIRAGDVLSVNVDAMGLMTAVHSYDQVVPPAAGQSAVQGFGRGVPLGVYGLRAQLLLEVTALYGAVDAQARGREDTPLSIGIHRQPQPE